MEFLDERCQRVLEDAPTRIQMLRYGSPEERVSLI